MKTNVVMKRPMGQFEVHQRTMDGMFNATSLLEQWNTTNPFQSRSLDNFWKSTHLTELMSEIAENEMGVKSVDFTELKNILSKTKRGRHSGGTWMHSFLFIKFAMYLSPKFEYSVLKFVHDELVKHRHIAGDNHNKLMASAVKLPFVNYAQIAKGINWIIFGKHEKNIRNKATPQQLQDLYELENQIAFSIDMGYVNTFDECMRSLRKLWDIKNRKF